MAVVLEQGFRCLNQLSTLQSRPTWAHRLQALLASVVAAPDAPVTALGILTTAERDLVLHGFNQVEVAPSRLLHPEQTIHGLLEHWAQATPHAVAAVFEVSASVVTHGSRYVRVCLVMDDVMGH